MDEDSPGPLPADLGVEQPPETEQQAKARVHRDLLAKAAESSDDADAMIILMAKGPQQILLHTPVMRAAIINMLEDGTLTLRGMMRRVEVEALVDAAVAKALARQKLMLPGGGRLPVRN